jgi:hypothetical protein
MLKSDALSEGQFESTVAIGDILVALNGSSVNSSFVHKLLQKEGLHVTTATFSRGPVGLKRWTRQLSQRSSQTGSCWINISSVGAIACAFARFANLAPLGFPTANARVVLAQPILACSGLENVVDVQGRILLVERGTCDFGHKAVAAEAAGAVGLIVMDTDSSKGAPVLVMKTAVLAASRLNLPVVSVTAAKAGILRKAAGRTNVSIAPTVLISQPDIDDRDTYEVLHSFKNQQGLGLGVGFPAGKVTSKTKKCRLPVRVIVILVQYSCSCIGV